MENKTLADQLFDRIVKKLKEKNFFVETWPFTGTVVYVPDPWSGYVKLGWLSHEDMLFGNGFNPSIFKFMAEWKKLPRGDSRNFLYRELSKALPGVEEISYMDAKTPEELDTWLGLYGV